MKVACLTMQRNERSLLVPWLRYHAARFGLENLFVFDNGSDEEGVISCLRHFEQQGLNVFWNHTTKADYERKGDIISEKIKELDRWSAYDFYFPLDCDEFICVRNEGGIKIEKDDIEKELSKYLNENKVLYIGSMLFNNPVIADEYMVYYPPEKCFFIHDTCESLDQGFHQGKSKKAGGRTGTAIAYIHFHNRPYDDYLFHAKQKMEGRLEQFGPGDAAKYVSEHGAGAHLVSRMLKTRGEYDRQFADRRNDPFLVREIVSVPEFSAHLKEIDAPIVWAVRKERTPLFLDNASQHASPHDLFGWWVDHGPNWKAMKGHVDSVSCDGGKVTLLGWASDRDGRPAPQLIVMADTEIVPTREYKAAHRPDVTAAFAGIGPYCGFHIVVEAADIPPDTHELRLVAHDPRDGSTCIVKGRFGHAIRWSDLAP